MATKEAVLEALKDIKYLLKDRFSIDSIGIFGSYAKDTFRKDSDIDIVYKLKDKRLGYKEYLDFENMIKSLFQNDIDLVNIETMNPLVKRKVLKDIIYV